MSVWILISKKKKKMNYKVAQKRDKLGFVLTSHGTRESDYGNNIYLVIDENKCLAYMNVSFDS